MKNILNSKEDSELKEILKSKHLDELRWICSEVLMKSFQIKKKKIEFIKCTNANFEILFSCMNSMWTDEKNKLRIKTVESVIIVKLFFL